MEVCKDANQMSSKQQKMEHDDKYEVEECFVYVDLDTKLLDDQLSKSNAKIKFLGIDTENPIMQINNQLFKGNEMHRKTWNRLAENTVHFIGGYDQSLGTHCFFTESKRPGGGEDACFQELPKTMYDYFAKTNKVLRMKRIFVKEKETEATNSELAEGEIENLEHLRISKTYGDALNQFLKNDEEPPRDIQDSQDSQESNDNDEDEADESTEANPNSEILQTDEPSEESENTNVIKQAKIETDAYDDLERLTDPDYVPWLPLTFIVSTHPLVLAIRALNVLFTNKSHTPRKNTQV